MNDETVGIPGGPNHPTGAPRYQPGPGPIPQQPVQGGPQMQYGPPVGQPMPPQFQHQAYPPMPSAWPLPRIAALAIVLAGLGTLIASLFSLYSAKVTPTSWDFSGSNTPTGTVSVGLGFYDTVPFQAPIIAVAIPMFMLIAGLTALPMLFNGQNQKPVLPAFFTLAATLVAIVLMFAGPMPGINVSGEMARELKNEAGTADINRLIDTVVPISPGVGLILALVFGILGAAAALYLYILAERGSRNPGVPRQPNLPAGVQPQGFYGGPQPGPVPMAPQYGSPPPGWQPPQAGQNW